MLMVPVELIQGFTLAEWREMDWWPEGRAAHVRPGQVGHEHEIVVNIDGYGHGRDEEYVPRDFFDVFRAVAPDRWKIENRGSRIEIHPTGRLFNGFAPQDVQGTTLVLIALGLKPEVIR